MARRITTITSFLIALLALGACGPDGASVLIVATEGGTISASAAEVVIPANSLPADTEVVIETADASAYPALEGANDQVLLLQPEGTVLETAATVRIDSSLVGANADQSVRVAQLIDGWVTLESSHDTETGDVTISVTRFAPLAIVVTDPAAGGSIEGTLLWGDSTPVDGAPVELMMGDTMVSSTTTAADGTFSFTGLDSGTYFVNVDYECMLSEGVSVVAGATATLDLTLCGG